MCLMSCLPEMCKNVKLCFLFERAFLLTIVLLVIIILTSPLSDMQIDGHFLSGGVLSFRRGINMPIYQPDMTTCLICESCPIMLSY